MATKKGAAKAATKSNNKTKKATAPKAKGNSKGAPKAKPKKKTVTKAAPKAKAAPKKSAPKKSAAPKKSKPKAKTSKKTEEQVAEELLKDMPLDSPVDVADDAVVEQSARTATRMARRAAREAAAGRLDPAEAERLAKKAEHMRELEKRRAEANRISANPPPPETKAPVVAASVASIEDARRKREVLEAVVGEDQGEIYVEMPEVSRYKLLHLRDKHNEAIESVKRPLIKKAQQELDEEIAKLTQEARERLDKVVREAVREDANCVNMNREYTEAVNEVIDQVGPKLRPGYAVMVLEPENGRVKTAYAPAQVGMKVDLP